MPRIVPGPASASRHLVSFDGRLHSLDWLRTVATLLVVVLHASIAYLVYQMPGLPWPTHAPVGSPSVDALAWWINGFIMPLFFLQSGFLACRVMRTRGEHGFLKSRLRRLLVSFALGCVLILPLDLYAMLLGWAGEGKITLHKLRSLKIDSPLGDNLWGVSHLWFLQYLIVYCVSAWSGVVLSQRLRRKVAQTSPLAFPRCLPRCHAATIPLLVVSTAALWWDPQILIGFRHSWFPLPANLLFYAPWFTLGWLGRAERDQIDLARSIDGDTTANHVERSPFVRHCELRVIMSFGLFMVLLPMIRKHIGSEGWGNERFMLVTAFVLHAWLAVTGWFGLSLKWMRRPAPKPVRYLSEASIWVYLFHHPVVLLTQVAVSQVAMPTVIRFLLASTIGVSLPLLTYSAFVRKTWIGVVLNGRRLGEPVAVEADVIPFPLQKRERLKKSA